MVWGLWLGFWIGRRVIGHRLKLVRLGAREKNLNPRPPPPPVVR